MALKAKSGKPLDRVFPDVVAALKALPVDRFVVDGELIPVGGELSFEALQVRLHPAESRVRRLAAEQPAVLVLFDCLMDAKGGTLLDAPLTTRRHELEALVRRIGDASVARLSPCTTVRKAACGWLDELGASHDGVVAKREDGAYIPGERAMLKIKTVKPTRCCARIV